jgi:hypothetical protein
VLFPPKTMRTQFTKVKGVSGIGLNKYVSLLLQTNAELPQHLKLTDTDLAFKMEKEFWDYYYKGETPGRTQREAVLLKIKKSIGPLRGKYNSGNLVKDVPIPPTKSVAYDWQGEPVLNQKTISTLEKSFSEAWTRYAYKGFPIGEREYHFHPERKWRFDFAWTLLKVSVELQGGTWMRHKTGHTSGVGVAAGYEKLNEAQRLGWAVIHLTASDMTKGRQEKTIHYVCDFLAGRTG